MAQIFLGDRPLDDIALVPKALVAPWNGRLLSGRQSDCKCATSSILVWAADPTRPGSRLPIRRDLIFAFRDVPDLLLLHAAVHKPSDDMRGV
jgi:hypothetical protein